MGVDRTGTGRAGAGKAGSDAAGSDAVGTDLAGDERTALVVDDQATARERMSAVLADAGWRVSTAGSALEAIEKARTERPAIIFMDIVMPGMDGYQACRRLAVDPATRAIPVVFVSTKCQRADQVWARMQGGKALIGKPYSDGQLLDALRFAVR